MEQLPRTHMTLRGPLHFVTNHSRVTRVSGSPPRLRRRRLMQQYLVTRDCFLPNGSWSQREFSSNPNTDFFF